MSDKINDIKRKIANDILTLMKTENLSWMKPWLHPHPAQNGETGHVYKGMNVFAVNMAMFKNKWTDPRFLTFNQMKNLGGSNKGQKSTAVIKFGTSKDKSNEDKRYSFARLHFVWRRGFGCGNGTGQHATQGGGAGGIVQVASSNGLSLRG